MQVPQRWTLCKNLMKKHYIIWWPMHPSLPNSSHIYSLPPSLLFCSKVILTPDWFIQSNVIKAAVHTYRYHWITWILSGLDLYMYKAWIRYVYIIVVIVMKSLVNAVQRRNELCEKFSVPFICLSFSRWWIWWTFLYTNFYLCIILCIYKMYCYDLCACIRYVAYKLIQ